MRNVFETREQIKITNIPRFQPELAYPRLSTGMLQRIRRFGVPEELSAGSCLVAQGAVSGDFYVVLNGILRLFVTDRLGDTQYEFNLGEGQFTGELDLLSSRPAMWTAETLTTCLALRLPREQLRVLMQSEADIANLILQASMWRRLRFLEDSDAGGITILGSENDAELLRIRRFFTQNSYPHHVVTPDSITSLQFGQALHDMALPAVVLLGGSILQRPSTLDLARSLGLLEQPDRAIVYDLLVVGAGPAGLAAAVYGASEGLRTLVLESIGPGGQAGTSSRIENYLGFPTGVSGEELAYRAQVQAQKFGATLTVAHNAVSLQPQGSQLCVMLSDGTEVCGRSVVIATGAQYRQLDAENYARFKVKGVQYAATPMEANLCRGQQVVVVGGGNSAGQAAVFLSGSAAHVHLLIRRDALDSTMSQYLISRITQSSSITLHTHTEITALHGENGLESASLRQRQTGTEQELPVRQMFVMIGAEPNTGWLYGSVALDKKGFVLTGAPNGFEASRYSTSLPGVFAVGDVRAGSVKRVASAVGEGSVVISDVHRYLASLGTAASRLVTAA